MRPTSKAILFAGVLSTSLLSGMATAGASDRFRVNHETTSTAASPRSTPRESAAAYWGPTAPAAPKKKPNAVRRMFQRLGTFLGSDEEIGTTPTFRDPATGRTNTGASKPYLKPRDQ